MTEFTRPNGGIAYANGDVPDQADFNVFRENSQNQWLMQSLSLRPQKTDVTDLGANYRGNPCRMHWNRFLSRYACMTQPVSYSYPPLLYSAGSGSGVVVQWAPSITSDAKRSTDHTYSIVLSSFGTDRLVMVYQGDSASTKVGVATNGTLSSAWDIEVASASGPTFTITPLELVHDYSSTEVYVAGLNSLGHPSVLRVRSESASTSSATVYNGNTTNVGIPLSLTAGPNYALIYAYSSVAAVGELLYFIRSSGTGALTGGKAVMTFPADFDQSSGRAFYDPRTSRYVLISVASEGTATANSIYYTTSSSASTWPGIWYRVPMTDVHIPNTSGDVGLKLHDATVTANGVWLALVEYSTAESSTNMNVLLASIDAGATWIPVSTGSADTIDSHAYDTLRFATGQGNSVVAQSYLNDGDYMNDVFLLGSMYSLPASITAVAV